MSTPFLLGFSRAIVCRLIERELLLLRTGDSERVIVYVANFLGTKARGGSLLSSLEQALFSCDEVDDLFADLEEMKLLVEDLRG